jgi:hypothetical protein
MLCGGRLTVGIGVGRSHAVIAVAANVLSRRCSTGYL